MKIIGITGFIGSGKSTAVKLISENYKTHNIILDEIAKDIILKNKYNDIIKDSNNLFSNEKIIEFIKKNVHEKVWDEVKNIIKNINKNEEYDYIIIETALPNDYFFSISDISIFITSKNSYSYIKNRNIDFNLYTKIIDEQKKYNYKKAKFIIENNNSLKDFEETILNTLKKYG